MLHKWKTVGISVAALCPVLFNIGFTHQQPLLQSSVTELIGKYAYALIINLYFK